MSVKHKPSQNKNLPIDHVKLFTDGACSGNPGIGGWGVLILWESHEEEIYGGEKDTTNNRMELMAAICGLESLPPGVKAKIFTDSKYVKNGITDWIKNWKNNGWKTKSKKPVKNIDLWMRLDRVIQYHLVDWEWVKGHSGHEENERADRLARQGVEDQQI